MASTTYKDSFTATVTAASATVNVLDRIGSGMRHTHLDLLNLSDNLIAVNLHNATASLYGDDCLAIPAWSFRRVRWADKLTAIADVTGSRLEITGSAV